MNAWLIRIVAAALAGLLLFACQSDEEKLAEHMSRGDAYFDNEKYGEAIIEYMSFLQIDPNDGVAHYKLSKALFKTNKVREGYWELRETVRLDPANLEAKIELSIMLLFAKEYEEALEQIDEAVAVDPGKVRAHAIRGQVLDALGRPEEALEAFATGVELDPEDRGALLLYAAALDRAGAREEAEEFFDKLVATHPDYGAYDALARFIARGRDQSRDAEVEAAYRKAIEVALPAEVPRGYKVLAGFQYSRDRIDDSIATLEEGIEKSEEKLDLIYTLARFHSSQGNQEKANALIEQATVAAPDTARPFLILSAHRDQNEDLAGALEAARRAAEIEPENEEAELRIAEVIIEIGVKSQDDAKVAEGRKLVEDLLAENPEQPAALAIRAKVDLYEKKVDDAIAVLRTAVSQLPDWAQAHFLLGTALAMKGDHTGARSELARALEIDATLVQARRVLAQVHADLRENEYAVEEGRRYLRERPDDVQVRILVAQSLIRLGKTAQAERELAAVPEAERTAEIHYAYGRIAMGKRDFPAAKAHLVRALDDLPANHDILNSLYLLEREWNGDTSESVARIQKALAENPDNARLVLLEGNIALAQHRGEDAEASFKRAIDLAPDDLKAYEHLARFYSATGRLQEAIDTYEAAVAARPQAAQLYHLLGVLYELGGEKEKAIANYEQAIRRAPNLGEAKNNLSYMFAESGKNLDRALELAQEAKALLPDNPNAADTLGWVLYRRGVPGAAISYLREAEATSDPGSPTLGLVRYHLALAYQSNGDDQEAAETLERALSDLDSQFETIRKRGVAVDEPAWATEARTMLAELQRS
ncbi:MAG: tetratricopeptide repeat protein [Myxococcota bacterium]